MPGHAGTVTDGLRIRGSVVVPESELEWRFSRSSGPGGQGVNTSDSRVELRFDLARTQALPAALRERALGRLADRLVDGVVVVTASEQRSQWQNRTAAQRRLIDLLAAAIAPPPRPRVATAPSASARRRRLEDKRRRGETKRLRRPGPHAD